MAAASRSLATALWGARFASGLLRPSYTINWDTTMTKTTETSNLPTHRVYAVKKISEDKSRWDEISLGAPGRQGLQREARLPAAQRR